MNARIVEILKMSPPKELSVSGWVRSFRGNRFIALNDGSCMASLQIVIDAENFSEEIVSNINNSASISVKGKLVPSQGGASLQSNFIERFIDRDTILSRLIKLLWISI